MTIEIQNSSGQTVYTKLTGNSIQPSTLTKDLTIDTGKTGTYDLTHVESGRIYFSYGKALSTDAPDGANSGDTDYYTRFDKIELTYDSGSGGKANLTSVDFYAIPFSLETYLTDNGTNKEICIGQFTLKKGSNGNALQTSILSVVGSGKTADAEVLSGKDIVRVLSPVKAPAAYASLDAYVDAVVSGFNAFDIKGTFYGTSGGTYDFAAAVDSTNITLTQTGMSTIIVPISSLKSTASNGSAIYTCNGPFTVGGNPATVSDNNIYSAVYRDLVAGLNFGYLKTANGTDSSAWWSKTPFSSASDYYNQYASEVNNGYPGAYGFPFSDRQKNVLLDLGGDVNKLGITVLADDASPTPITLPGVLNPQSKGANGATFNIAFTFGSTHTNEANFTFGTNPAEIGSIYNYQTKAKGPSSGSATSAQVTDVTAQDGWNKYDMLLLGKPFTVLAKVDNKVVTQATIAGGGSATYASGVLFLGSLDS